MSQSVCEMVELGGGGVVKGGMVSAGQNHSEGSMQHTWRQWVWGVWVGGLNPLERTRGGRSSTASDQESLSVQSWSMPGSGWRPDSNVHSISDDDLVGKVVATVSI